MGFLEGKCVRVQSRRLSSHRALEKWFSASGTTGAAAVYETPELNTVWYMFFKCGKMHINFTVFTIFKSTIQ